MATSELERAIEGDIKWRRAALAEASRLDVGDVGSLVPEVWARIAKLEAQIRVLRRGEP